MSKNVQGEDDYFGGLINPLKRNQSFNKEGAPAELERQPKPVQWKHTSDHILDTIDDPIFGLDSELRIIFTNQAGEVMAGCSREYLIGKPVVGVFPTASREVLSKIAESIKEQKPRKILAYAPPFGKWLEVRSFPHLNGTICMVDDVSEKVTMTLHLQSLNLDHEKEISLRRDDLARLKQYEKALRASEQKLMDIINFLPDATFVIDKQGRVIAWNKAIEDMTGVQAADILGCGEYSYGIPFYGFPRPVLIDLVGNFNREHTNDYLSIRSQQATIEGENFCPALGESGAYVYAKASPLYDADGNVVGAIESMRDISDRKQAEEQLRQSEERFFKVFHNSPDLMVLYDDRKYSVIEVNQRVLDTLGLSREEVIGSDPIRLGLVNKSQYVSILTRLRREGKILNYELDVLTRSGRLIKSISTLEYVYLNGTICILLVSKDVSKERQMEADLARFDRLNLIGEMAASIGHEVRNPMTAVRGFLQLLNSREDNPENRSYYQLMMEELDRANRIISEFLTMARDKRVQLERQSLNGIIRAIAPIIQAEALMRDKQVILDLGPDVELLLDQSEIRQMILNLSRNGLEAMSTVGVLTIGTRVGDKENSLYIKDQGSGFSLEAMNKAGTPFFSTKDSGSGLGLAVCYSIANRHKARIEIESSVFGSTIFVKFAREA
ncbi:MAG: PAS domain S-box protein [Syntrophomonadaceae bacterium]